MIHLFATHFEQTSLPANAKLVLNKIYPNIIYTFTVNVLTIHKIILIEHLIATFLSNVIAECGSVLQYHGRQNVAGPDN